MVLLCVFFGWQSVRLGMDITPKSAEYYFRQGDLERALTLNPRYTAAWIALGIEAETRGDRGKAEASLIRAAAMDHTYLPRWTLANFYLRAGNMPQFWIWARQSAEIAHDPTALFQLCWRASGDAREILERVIPTEPAARRAYFDFLVRTERIEAAEPLVDAVSDRDLLLRYCDAALNHKQVSLALKAWNGLAARRLIPYHHGGALTNGDFSAAPLGRGFDWRPLRVEGTSLSFDPVAREMPVELSGRQPESFDLVEQYVPLEPVASYEFQFLFRAQDKVAGLSWVLVDAVTGAELASAGVRAEGGGTVRFSTPAGCDLARLVLRYRRPAGSMRAEGRVVFSRFALERVR
jgi:hypothetical protein